MTGSGVDGRAGEHAFRTRVAVLIAVVSIAGVLCAWQASNAADEASGLDQQGLQHLVHQEQELIKLEGIVDQDLRLLNVYQEHVKAWSLLKDEADGVRAQDPRLADSLDQQAREQHTLARSLRPFFLSYTPDNGGDEGTVVYDVGEAMQDLVYFDEDLKEFRPQEVLAQAAAAHDTGVQYQGLTALFAVALFLLTLAELARSALRRYFAVTGGVVAAAGVVLFAAAVVGAT